MRTLIAVALLLAAGLLFFQRPGRSDGVEAGTALRLDLPGLVEHSDLIVEGRVLSEHVLRLDDGRLETEFLLEVDRTFLGEDQIHRAVRLPGGVLEDGSGLLLAGMPGLHAGENVLLFLSAEASSGARMPVGLAQGKFSVLVDADGHKSLVRNGACLGLVSPDSGSLSHGQALAVLEYAAVVAEIEAALAKEDAR